MYGDNAHNIYAQNELSVESPIKLTEMLFQGVLRFNAQAKKAIKDNDIEKKVYWINRSIAVVTELASVLDIEQGQIAQYLDGLYAYQIKLLIISNSRNDLNALDEVSTVFKGLLEAWRDTTSVA